MIKNQIHSVPISKEKFSVFENFALAEEKWKLKIFIKSGNIKLK
jgi:hypothetical protein